MILIHVYDDTMTLQDLKIDLVMFITIWIRQLREGVRKNFLGNISLIRGVGVDPPAKKRQNVKYIQHALNFIFLSKQFVCIVTPSLSTDSPLLLLFFSLKSRKFFKALPYISESIKGEILGLNTQAVKSHMACQCYNQNLLSNPQFH